jgi:hypothetical protein
LKRLSADKLLKQPFLLDPATNSRLRQLVAESLAAAAASKKK